MGNPEPQYKRAPISELVCGVIFDSGILESSGIIYDLIAELRKTFPHVEQLPSIFDEKMEGYALNTFPVPGLRFRLKGNDTPIIIQIQSNKFYFNWIRADDKEVGHYPGFNKLYSEFQSVYGMITKELDRALPEFDLAKATRQYELTYQDRFPWKDYVQDLVEINDWINIQIPDIPRAEGDGSYSPNNMFTKFPIPIEELGGYGIVSLNTHTINDKQILSVQLVLKGKKEPMDKWFESGNKFQNRFFNTFFKDKIRKSWK